MPRSLGVIPGPRSPDRWREPGEAGKRAEGRPGSAPPGKTYYGRYKKGEPESPACAAAGDLSVEGVLFIPASRSPIGVPLVVLSHETSDRVTLFRVDGVP